MADTEIDGDNALDEYEKSFNEFSGIDQDEGDILHDEDDDTQEDVSNGEDEGEVESIETLRQQLEAERNERLRLQQERNELEHSFNSQRGRVSALQKKIDSESKTDEVVYDEKIKDLIEDYPDLIKPVVEYFDEKVKAVTGGVTEKLSYFEQLERQRYVSAQIAEMNAFMPDWGNVVASEGYNNWLAQQPKSVQNMAQSVDAEDYKYLLNAYKSQTRGQANDLTESRQRRLAANVSIKSKGHSSRATPPEDFQSAFEYYAAKNR